MSSDYERELAAKYRACCEAMRPLMDSPRAEDEIEYSRLQDEVQRLWDEMQHLKRPRHASR